MRRQAAVTQAQLLRCIRRYVDKWRATLSRCTTDAGADLRERPLRARQNVNTKRSPVGQILTP